MYITTFLQRTIKFFMQFKVRRSFSTIETSETIITPINQEICCGLCFQTDELNVLKCNHVICESCIETQKLYTYEPCFLCLHVTWNANKKLNGALDEYSKWRLKQNQINRV